MLGGVPGLRGLPVLGSIPGIRGLMNVHAISFPDADQARLRDTVNEQTAAFITPNHPEFLTDWLLDKYVISRAAPMAASWATHAIVNGLGKHMQNFWLKNNLIAQIPGAGGQAGKDYSVSWACKGNGVLLHPEGSVGWHGDHIGALFPGAAEMALQTARDIAEDNEKRPVFIAPVIWKLFFLKDVSHGLYREMDYIEQRLKLPKGAETSNPAQRLYGIYDGLLARDEVRFQIHPTDRPYFSRLKELEAVVSGELEGALNAREEVTDQVVDVTSLLRLARRTLREGVDDPARADHIKETMKTLERLLRMKAEHYQAQHLTQEHVAESLKRIRADYCRATKRDITHNYAPVPVGPRRAVLRVPEPLRVTTNSGTSDVLTARLRTRMQGSLDALLDSERDRQSKLPTYENPFL